MHKIYEDEGDFNFVYQIPQIIYSSIISNVINHLIKFLSLSNKNIIEIKKKESYKIALETKTKTLKTLNIKFVFFFLISFIFLIMFWFYLGSFCYVYNNTQIQLIKDIAISYVSSILTPFTVNLFPGLLRIPSLRKKDRKCMYNLSKILQLL